MLLKVGSKGNEVNQLQQKLGLTADGSFGTGTEKAVKDWQTANVILDFKEQKVLAARMHDTSIPKDWDRIVGYYYQFYTQIMERLFEENGHKAPNTSATESASLNL